MSKSERQRISNEFADIIKDLKKNGYAVENLARLKIAVNEEILRLQRAVEFVENRNTKTVTPDNRYLVSTYVSSANAKLTFRPETGELLLKIPDGTPPHKIDALKSLALYVMEKIPSEIPVTLRGTCHWSESHQIYKVTMQSESKKFYYDFALPLIG